MTNDYTGPDLERRFGGIGRLYGADALSVLERAHVCVIGMGGVGAWAAEALGRSGIGELTLIDLDHVSESNINRQIHALTGTLGQSKVTVMAERLLEINPNVHVHTIEEFVTPDNAIEILSGFDLIIDAVDQVRSKAAIAAVCKTKELPLLMAGGAGGKISPGGIRAGDLAYAIQDPLLARVRSILRRQYGFTRKLKHKFGVEAIYSIEPLRYPDAVCTGERPQGLGCAGYGSSVMMTASVGLFIAARAIERLLDVKSVLDG